MCERVSGKKTTWILFHLLCLNKIDNLCEYVIRSYNIEAMMMNIFDVHSTLLNLIRMESWAARICVISKNRSIQGKSGEINCSWKSFKKWRRIIRYLFFFQALNQILVYLWVGKSKQVMNKILNISFVIVLRSKYSSFGIWWTGTLEKYRKHWLIFHNEIVIQFAYWIKHRLLVELTRKYVSTVIFQLNFYQIVR